MTTPLTRKEMNRIKGAGSKFNHYMGVMRYRGGMNNAVGSRAFLAYMDNGFRHPLKVEIKAPVGDLSRFERNGETFDFQISAGKYDLAGFQEADFHVTGKFKAQSGYDYGYTSEDRENQAIAAGKLEEEKQAIHVAKQSKAAARWRARQARKGTVTV